MDTEALHNTGAVVIRVHGADLSDAPTRRRIAKELSASWVKRAMNQRQQNVIDAAQSVSDTARLLAEAIEREGA